MTSSTEKKDTSNGTTTSGFGSVRAACSAQEIESIEFVGDAEPSYAATRRPRRKDAESCIIDAALEFAISGDVRARVASSEIMVAVVNVPGAEWVRPVEQRLNRLLGNRWFTIARDGSNKSRDKATVGNGEVASAIAQERCVAGIAPLTSMLPSSLVAAADFTIEIGYPDAAVIARAVGDYVGEAAHLAETLPGRVDLSELVTAFRPGSSATQIFERIRRTAAPGTSSMEQGLPSLEGAVEYGEARQWGLAAVSDFREYQAGRLSWGTIESSAIFFGAPGLGKTYFARILAQALGIPLIATSIADLFSTSAGYLDSVIKATNDVFAKAESAAPCLLFLDELDALPGRQNLDERSGSWWTPVIANFLLLLDSAVAGKREGVFVVAATNLVDRIDPALRRPGRFERLIEMKRPDAAGIVSIVRNQLGADLANVDISPIGNLAADATSAQLMQFVRTARRSARHTKRDMTLADLVDAIVPPLEVPAQTLRRVAVHEAGHMVVAMALGSDEIVMAAIGGREGAHGHTLFRRVSELETVNVIEARVAMAMGGRAAEMAIIGECCSGSGGDETSDLHHATSLLASLHFSEGMAASLVYLAASQDVVALLRLDPSLREIVERHLRRLQDRAIEIVNAHRPAVLAIADALADRRHLTGAEARRIFDAATGAVPNECDKMENDGC